MIRFIRTIFPPESSPVTPLHILSTRSACGLCKKDSSLDIRVTREQADAYLGGAMIQDVCPELSVDIREQLISGMHGKCFDELFDEAPEEE